MERLQHMRRRPGFSLVELMIVVTIVGMLTIMAVPKIKRYRDTYNVQAGRERVMAAVAGARASAIHKGRESLFLTSGNWISIWTKNPTTGFWQQQVPWEDLNVINGVQLQLAGSGWNYVWFEPRGLTMYKPASVTVFRVVGGSGKKDSVCVTRQGQILPRGCTL